MPRHPKGSGDAADTCMVDRQLHQAEGDATVSEATTGLGIPQRLFPVFPVTVGVAAYIPEHSDCQFHWAGDDGISVSYASHMVA